MGERRMFSKIIIDSDLFLDMPATAQLLYFHLGMCADDEGFVNNPKKVQRSVGCTDDDLKLLIAKRFIIPFESGVIVIRHWHIHNTLRKDRAKMTVFKDERQQIIIDESGAYCLNGNHLTTKCQPNGNHLSTKCPHNIREDNIREYKIRDISEPFGSEPTPTPLKPAVVRHKYGEYKNVLLTDEEFEKLKKELPGSYKDYIERLSEYMASKGARYKSHFATIRNWARKDKQERKGKTGSSSNSYDRDILEVLNDDDN